MDVKLARNGGPNVPETFTGQPVLVTRSYSTVCVFGHKKSKARLKFDERALEHRL